MADIQTQQSHHKNRGTTSKKLSTKIDLTPMVDLGFLLIAFFMFTTTLNTPKITGLIMPADNAGKPPPQAAFDKTLQLVLAGNNKIICYNGDDINAASVIDYSTTGLRNIILQKQKLMQQKFKRSDDMVLFIKPTNQSNYKNLLAVMDEVAINRIGTYFIVDVSAMDVVISRQIL
jgi:biopolymer transport protein ExbD